MKKIKFLAVIAAVAIALPAMSATVTWTGGANARYGYQQLNADNTHMWSAVLMSALSGNVSTFGNDLQVAGADIGAAIGTDLITATLTPEGSRTPAQVALLAKAESYGYNASAVSDMATGVTEITRFLGARPTAVYGMGGFVDKTYTEKGHYFGLKNESSVNIAANIVSDSKKLTGKINVKFATPEDTFSETRPIDLEEAWLQYDLGMLAIRYDTGGLYSRWDSDVIYVGDYTGQNSLDFQIKAVPDMGYAFITFMSDAGLDGVKYQNTEERSSLSPMISAGYVYETSMIDATIGGVYDKYDGLDNDDYTGYMGFAEVKVKSGQMGTQVGSYVVKLAGLYGKNTARFAGMDPADMEQATLGVSNLDDYLMAAASDTLNPVDLEFNTVSKDDKDSTVMGAHLSATYTAWMGGMINFDARVSQLKLYGNSDAYFSQRYTLAIIQALDANFFVTLAGGYEQYSVVPGDKDYDAAWGYEATIDFGYRF